MTRRILAMLLALSLMLGGACALAETSEGEWKNILLLGCDDRDVSQHAGRTDTMMILSYNREQGCAKLTSIMRDTWVSISGHGNNKINAANVFGGPELAVQTVNENFGTDIENYMLINMRDMVDIVDLFGGVDLELSDSEVKIANDYINGYKDSVYNEKEAYADYSLIAASGLVHLNGMQAMAHCRDRYTDSDYGRVMRGQDTLLAVLKNAQNMEVDEVANIAGSIADFVVTNMTADELKDLATVALTVEPTEVGQNRIPADGTFKSGTFSGTWMIKANFSENAELLHQFIYGD